MGISTFRISIRFIRHGISSIGDLRVYICMCTALRIIITRRITFRICGIHVRYWIMTRRKEEIINGRSVFLQVYVARKTWRSKFIRCIERNLIILLYSWSVIFRYILRSTISFLELFFSSAVNLIILRFHVTYIGLRVSDNGASYISPTLIMEKKKSIFPLPTEWQLVWE